MNCFAVRCLIPFARGLHSTRALSTAALPSMIVAKAVANTRFIANKGIA